MTITVYNENGDAWIGRDTEAEFLDWLADTGHRLVATYGTDVIVEDLTDKPTLRNRLGHYQDIFREVLERLPADIEDQLYMAIKEIIDTEDEDDHIEDVDIEHLLNGGAQ